MTVVLSILFVWQCYFDSDRICPNRAVSIGFRLVSTFADFDDCVNELAVVQIAYQCSYDLGLDSNSLNRISVRRWIGCPVDRRFWMVLVMKLLVLFGHLKMAELAHPMTMMMQASKAAPAVVLVWIFEL